MAANVELIIAIFLLISFVAAIISIRSKTPYTLILVLIGIGIIAVADLLALAGGPLHGFAQGVIDQISSFDNLLLEGGGNGIFVGLIVPPLVFESMMHIRGGELRSVIRPAIVLATIGVVIATLTGGLVLIAVGLSYYVAFLFAALIAPTDVVTILEVFRRVKVPNRLSILLNTEAAFNDATAIVIFTIILTSATLSQAGFIEATASFVFTLLGGLFIGLGIAFLGELLSSLIEDRVSECILTVSVVYGAFALATGIGASGIIAVAVAGLYFGNFTMRTAMESTTRNTVNTFWEVIAFLANSIAFLFIGFQTDLLTLGQSIVLIAIAFTAVTIARIVTVYPILGFFSKRVEKTSRLWSHVAVLGGVRGALSIVLAATITVSAVITQTDVAMIRTMALGVAFLSMTLQVPFLFRFVKAKFKNEELQSQKSDDDLRNISTCIEETHRLKTEGKISQKEFEYRLEEYKSRIDEAIHGSSVLLETKDIIKKRAELLYSSVKKKSKLRKRRGEKSSIKAKSKKSSKLS